jgi:glycosyltransferase involved in cell wall biosynthesis
MKKKIDNISSTKSALILMNTLSIGGSERKTVCIANELARAGWTITIAYLNSPHTLESEIAENVHVLCLYREGRLGIKALKNLVNYIKQNEIPIICCINLYPVLYAFIASKFTGSEKPKIIATSNTTLILRRVERLKMILYAALLRRVDGLVFGCKYQMDLWVQKYNLERRKCIYIYNGVNVDHFKATYEVTEASKLIQLATIPDDAFVVGSIGRFRKEKRYEKLIRTAVALRNQYGINVHCLLVGGGAEEDQLRGIVSELNCESYVHLVDAVNDVRPYLLIMDVFVLTSTSETFSNSALEAMSMEVPVVLPDVGGCPEMISHGYNGYIYNVNSSVQLKKYLALLAKERKNRAKMGKRARQHVVKRFGYEKMINQYIRQCNTGK